METRSFDELFLAAANKDLRFKEAVDIVLASADGSVWLMGGFVCRSIIQELYGVPMSHDVDFDFLVEKPLPLAVPSGWRLEKNSYGNPKLIGPSYEIDYVPLPTVHSIARRGLAPTIENFLSGTPLTIQSIVFDVRSGRVIGDVGIQSIKDKTVGVNNLEQASYRAGKKGTNVEDLVRRVAEEFGFSTQSF